MFQFESGQLPSNLFNDGFSLEIAAQLERTPT